MSAPSPFEPALTPGCTIGVMAPSSFTKKDSIKRSVEILESRGYKVFIHPQTFERDNQSAGTALQKSLAFQGLMQRPDIDVIWCAGGGNHSMGLLEAINFDAMKAVKPVCGFSDNTTLLNAMAARRGGVHFHAPVFQHFATMDEAKIDHVLAVMSGEVREMGFELGDVLQAGEAEGRLIGGNLSLFQYLPSLLRDDYTDGAILFLEDCKEELSHLDRMFSFLRVSGVLEKISGLMLGQFTDLTDSGRPFGMDLLDIVREHMTGYDVPIIYNLPFGHDYKKPFTPLPVGASVTVSCDSAAISW